MDDDPPFSRRKESMGRWFLLLALLSLSACLVPPPTYRLYNSTLLELNTTTPLDLNATVVGLSCNGNSSMNLTLVEGGENDTTTRFSVQGCLVPLGVRAFTSDGDIWTVLASSDPGPACFPPPTCEEYVFGDATTIPAVNKTFWDLDPTQQAAVILLSALGGLVLGLVIAVLWRGCCFKIHQHRNRFSKI